MVEQLEERSEEFGFLGATDWMGAARESRNTTLNVMYFKSYQGVHAYAQSQLHREAWNWYNNDLAKDGQFGIFHELYQVPSGNWETVYANIQPTGLSSTMHQVTNEEGNKVWMTPIVDASKGLLKSSRGRMSRSDGKDTENLGLADFQAKA